MTCGYRFLHIHAQRTYFGCAAEVDERPVVLLRSAEDVAGLDVPVCVATAVQLL